MKEEDRNCTRVETSVDGIENGTGHGYRKVELVHGWDVGGNNGYHVALPDAERYN